MTTRKRSGLPQHVTMFKDRHGRRRYRFRRKGQQDYYFKADPRTDPTAFRAELEDCRLGVTAPRVEPGKGRYKPGTLDDLVRRYYASPEFLNLADSTKATYRGIIDRFRKGRGDRPVRLIERTHLRAIIGSMSDRPGAANKLLDRLKSLMRFAVDEGMRRDNPALGLKGYSEGKGFHTWTDDEIAKYRAKHQVGSKARLAMELLLYTGQRRSDVVRMGWQHVSGNRISVVQQKTGTLVDIPMHPDLSMIIRKTPRANLTFVMTEIGAPFTVAGFGNWFREQCDLAGLPNCSAHGLRKAAARRLAEAGCTPHEIMAVTGHQTLSEVTRYTEQANRKQLADDAIAKVKTRTKTSNPRKKVAKNDS